MVVSIMDTPWAKLSEKQKSLLGGVFILFISIYIEFFIYVKKSNNYFLTV